MLARLDNERMLKALRRRDKASNLISELGSEHAQGIPVIQPGMRESRKKRTISAQTRAKMRMAAKRRWAEMKNMAKAKVSDAR